MEMARVYGLSKDGIKAFNEGNVTLKFSKRKGWEVKTYKSKAWLLKALRKAKEDGRYIMRVFTEDSDLCICFSDKGMDFFKNDKLAYRQFSASPNTVTIIKPLAFDFGYRRV